MQRRKLQRNHSQKKKVTDLLVGLRNKQAFDSDRSDAAGLAPSQGLCQVPCSPAGGSDAPRRGRGCQDLTPWGWSLSICGAAGAHRGIQPSQRGRPPAPPCLTPWAEASPLWGQAEIRQGDQGKGVSCKPRPWSAAWASSRASLVSAEITGTSLRFQCWVWSLSAREPGCQQPRALGQQHGHRAAVLCQELMGTPALGQRLCHRSGGSQHRASLGSPTHPMPALPRHWCSPCASAHG